MRYYNGKPTEFIKLMIALNNGKEFECEIMVQYFLDHNYNDFQHWDELWIDKVEIWDLSPEEAQEILNNKIDIVHIEDLLGHESDIDFIFGNNEEFIKELTQISKMEAKK